MPKKLMRSASALVLFALLLSAAVLPGCGIIIIRDGSETTASDNLSESAGTTAGTAAADTTKPYAAITTADAKEKAKSALDKVFIRDFGGISIFIASTSPENFAPSEVINDVTEARYFRQKLVEDKLNTTILTIGGTPDQIFEDLRAAEKAGTYYADIIAVPMRDLGRFVAAGLLLRVNSLPFLDLGADWFNQECMAQVTAGYRSAYTVVGDANLEPGKLYSALFNKELAAAAGEGDLYRLAYSGGWTWERMLAAARAAASSADGTYGVASAADPRTLVSALYAASGEKLFSPGSDGALSAAFGTERAGAVVEKIKEFFAPDVMLLGSVEHIPVSDAPIAFYEGGAAFLVAPLETLEWFKNMKKNWGVLPLPKFDEAQSRYYSYVDGSALSFSTPAGNENIEAAGVFMSAFFAASGDTIADAFYTHLIKYVIRESDSLNMIDLIRGGASLGFEDAFASGYQIVEQGALGSLYNAVRGRASLGYYFNNYSYQLDSLIRKFI